MRVMRGFSWFATSSALGNELSITKTEFMRNRVKRNF